MSREKTRLVERHYVMREITIAELKEQSKESYQLIDIRDEGSTVYGMIPGAICIPIKQLMENLDGCVNRIKNNAKVVIYCQRGEKSRDIAESLEEMGLDCYSLAGGYNAFLMRLIRLKRAPVICVQE